MQALTAGSVGRPRSADASFRQLTPVDTTLVAGAVIPIVVFAVAAAVQGSCSGEGEGDNAEQSDD